jgi:hypothetical protein
MWETGRALLLGFRRSHRKLLSLFDYDLGICGPEQTNAQSTGGGEKMDTNSIAEATSTLAMPRQHC